jgi:hypothetical protein
MKKAYKSIVVDGDLKEYDKKGNLIHRKCSNGYEEWNEFDKKNNVIYSKNSDGYEWTKND